MKVFCPLVKSGTNRWGFSVISFSHNKWLNFLSVSIGEGVTIHRMGLSELHFSHFCVLTLEVTFKECNMNWENVESILLQSLIAIYTWRSSLGQNRKSDRKSKWHKLTVPSLLRRNLTLQETTAWSFVVSLLRSVQRCRDRLLWCLGSQKFFSSINLRVLASWWKRHCG